MDWEEGERWRKGAEKDMPEDESEDKEGPRANFSHTPIFLFSLSPGVGRKGPEDVCSVWELWASSVVRTAGANLLPTEDICMHRGHRTSD